MQISSAILLKINYDFSKKFFVGKTGKNIICVKKNDIENKRVEISLYNITSTQESAYDDTELTA